MRYALDTRRVLEAYTFAEKAHKGQTRRGTNEPYYFHPIAVSLMLLSFKRSHRLTELVIAAVLHDVLEDTKVTFDMICKKFGPFVAGLVLELTNDEAEIARIGKKEYHKAKLTHMSSYALLIKLCDRLHNVSDKPSEQMKKDTTEIMSHLLAKRRNLTMAQLELVTEIQLVCTW